MWRGVSVVILLGACDSGPSPEQQIADLEARTEIVCVRSAKPYGPVDYDVDQMIACMNDALFGGKRAEATWQVYTPKAYTLTTWAFTGDNVILAFEDVPNDATGGPSDMYVWPHCLGPFRRSPTDSRSMEWGGCPE